MRRLPLRWAVVSVVVLALAGLGYWGVKTISADKTKGGLVMATKPVTRGDIEVTVRGWGMLQAREEQDVLSGAAGLIKETFFQPGQQVTKGQVLATIDAGSLGVKTRQLEITIEMERVELAGSFGVPISEVESVDPQVALTLRSPMTGRLSGLTVSAGSTVQAGKMCSVVDDARLVIDMQVTKPIFDAARVGAAATFRAARFDGNIEGVVTKADPNPIMGTQAFLYSVSVEVPNPGLLKVGDTGTVIIHGDAGDVAHDGKVASPGSQEEINAAFGGRVKKVFTRDGMTVQKGDPILEFEPGSALLSAMTAQLEFKGKLIELEDLRSQMQNLTIVSPMDGIALTKNINNGQEIAKGAIVTRVSNFASMDLMLQVDEMDVPKVQPGQAASVSVWGPSGQQKISATVSQLGATGNQRDGMSSFNITLAVDNPGFIRPGMGAEAQIFVSRKQNILLCPVEALYKGDNGEWLVDTKSGNERTPVPVKVGVMNDTFAEVIEGLTEGQEVVVGMSKNQPTDGKGAPGVIRMPSGGVKVIR